MRVHFLIPPMTQVNTPYPSTAFLCGFLRGHPAAKHWSVTQDDWSIRLLDRVLSADFFGAARTKFSAEFMRDAYLSKNFEAAQKCIGPVKEFLRGKNSTLAYTIARRDFLPEGERFRALFNFSEGSNRSAEEADWQYLHEMFGAQGLSDRAKYLASLFLDDQLDWIARVIDPGFYISKYAEKLAASQPSFDPLYSRLQAPANLIDQLLEKMVEACLAQENPEVIAITAPFPGNVYASFKIAQLFKQKNPAVVTLLGGGYANTELRKLNEPRVFDFFDAVLLDDGEAALMHLLQNLAQKKPLGTFPLLRTFIRDPQTHAVVFSNAAKVQDVPQKQLPAPDYAGLPLGLYLQILEFPNPVHRIWSDGRWNKLMLAHGCYWKKCAFCDVNLDYIGRYDPANIEQIIERMKKIFAQTGVTGFHFVDEACPPKMLKALAEEIVRQKLPFSWWGNVRFDPYFTPEVCATLARGGCLAMTGGLEVAGDRLLKLMQKGISVEQVARVTKAMTDAGILVHAYLMYGFPTQTTQETIDALEYVRRLFAEGCLQSAFWHRFSATVHSPVGHHPEAYGIKLLPREAVLFSENDVPFYDPVGAPHDELGEGLKLALFNFMSGAGLDLDVRHWFAKKLKVPKASIASWKP